MKNEECIYNLKRALSVMEVYTAQIILKLIGGETYTSVNCHMFCEKNENMSRSRVSVVLKVLEACGIIRRQSLGTKGTMMKITDMKAAEEILKLETWE